MVNSYSTYSTEHASRVRFSKICLLKKVFNKKFAYKNLDKENQNKSGIHQGFISTKNTESNGVEKGFLLR